jgi:hypothetical protein
MFTHVVLFRFHDPHDAHEARARLLSLVGRVPSLRALEAGVDVLRTERSVDLALITRFDDQQGFADYAVDPVHAEVVAWMKPRIATAAAADFPG